MGRCKRENVRYISIKYRLYPTKSQIDMLEKTFYCCCLLWNLMLADKMKGYAETGKTPLDIYPARYKNTYPILKEIDTMALSNVQMSLERAYSMFFKKLNRFPKFKSEKHYKKYYITNCVSHGIRFDKNKIRLPKIGFVKTKVYRIPDSTWRIRNAHVSKGTDGKYYISVTFEYDCGEQQNHQIDTNKAIGLDYKPRCLYVDSNGNVGVDQTYIREGEKKIAKMQQQLKKKVLNSKRFKKQRQKISKVFKHIVNKRRDELHKKSTELTNEFDLICIETLDLVRMSRKKNYIGRIVMNSANGIFTSMLKYKARDRGKEIIEIDQLYPSTQTCSSCGHTYRISSRSKQYHCDVCGLDINRDYNAAINILNEGVRLYKERVGL